MTNTTQKIILKDLLIDDLLQRQPDIILAKQLLNWEPKVGREEGMRKTFEHFKSLSNEDLFKREHKDFSKHIKP